MDKDDKFRDSHTGGNFPGGSLDKVPISTLGQLPMKGDGVNVNRHLLFTNTRIPIDYNEWYFVCASFNPFVDEDNSFNQDSENFGPLNSVPQYWKNKIDPSGAGGDGSYVPNTLIGAQCKVDIISRSDLLRARGYKF